MFNYRAASNKRIFSNMLTITFDPIEQLSPITTLLSIIDPIKQFFPIFTFLFTNEFRGN